MFPWLAFTTYPKSALGQRGLEGRYREALAAFDSGREVNRLGLDTRADTVPALASLLAENGADREHWYGVRVFTDHLDDQPAGPEPPDVLETEWEAGEPPTGTWRAWSTW